MMTRFFRDCRYSAVGRLRAAHPPHPSTRDQRRRQSSRLCHPPVMIATSIIFISSRHTERIALRWLHDLDARVGDAHKYIYIYVSHLLLEPTPNVMVVEPDRWGSAITQGKTFSHCSHVNPSTYRDHDDVSGSTQSPRKGGLQASVGARGHSCVRSQSQPEKEGPKKGFCQMEKKRRKPSCILSIPLIYLHYHTGSSGSKFRDVIPQLTAALFGRARNF